MSFQRRAGAPRLIDWTGERCVPWAPDVPVVYEHFHRYLWAAQLVGGGRVLDLGSGEGFGAALLAESASHVVGIDVDELTVEHSRLNYAGPKLDFQLGTAVDLGDYEDGSFDVVVAFEVLEHVVEQRRLLSEVARVLRDDGILIISTPDRRMYGESRTEPNPFHEHELGVEEFAEMLGEHFPHLQTWGQRTITGSHLSPLGDAKEERLAGGSEFFIERAGDEWRLASTPAVLYCIALASRSELPQAPASSTLADCGLELMRVKERDATAAARETERLEAEKRELSQTLEAEKRELSQRLERETQELTRALEGERVEFSATLERERGEHAGALRERDVKAREVREQRELEVFGAEEELERYQQTLIRGEQTINELRAHLAAVEAQLALVGKANQRISESVTWRAFQRTRNRLYRTIGGERSLRARMLGASLRFAGRHLGRRRPSSPAPAPAPAAQGAAAAVPEPIQLLEYDQPQVSLIIPVHAHAALTRACLISIRERTVGVTYEVILVDDTADAETQQLLETVRGARIVRNESNCGFLRSMNRGASVARGEWLVLFNNDTEVTRGWLAAMLECANSADDVGVVTPKFVYPDGVLNEAGGIVWRDGSAMNYGRGDSPDRFQYNYRRETDYGSAAALMVRAELWREVGGFDERYRPIYYEDTDLCFQARERGLRVLYEPEAVIVHIEGATSGTDLTSGTKRFQEQNRKKFVERWRRRLEAEHRYSSPANARTAADRHRGPHILVVDHRVPMPDRDSGSLRMLSIMRALVGLGARVTFMPDNLAQVEPYTRRLQRMGIEVLYGHIDAKAELAKIGPSLSMAIVCRPHTTSRWLDTLREFAPTARIVYDTVDLHWLRESRKHASVSLTRAPAASNGSLDQETMWPKAKALRELELAMIRATDAALVVSEGERAQVEHDVPGASVLVVPNVHDVESYVPPPEGRSGIFFVGGFEHVPNVDAALHLVNDVMPAVWSELGDVQVTIVGPSAPPEVEALASPRVNVIGWVEDIDPLLEQSRMMLAPLRYGAGLKGKVTQCLAVGLPVVTTPIGAEGLIADSDDPVAQCLLVADDARGLAAETIRLYRDDELWRRLSRAGQELIAERCSTAVVSGRLEELLEGELSNSPAMAQRS